MDNIIKNIKLIELLPLPWDIIYEIRSYIIQRFSKKDIRYKMLLTIPKKSSLFRCIFIRFVNSPFMFIVNVQPMFIYYRFENINNYDMYHLLNNEEYQYEYFLR